MACIMLDVWDVLSPPLSSNLDFSTFFSLLHSDTLNGMSMWKLSDIFYFAFFMSKSSAYVPQNVSHRQSKSTNALNYWLKSLNLGYCSPS